MSERDDKLKEIVARCDVIERELLELAAEQTTPSDRMRLVSAAIRITGAARILETLVPEEVPF